MTSGIWAILQAGTKKTDILHNIITWNSEPPKCLTEIYIFASLFYEILFRHVKDTYILTFIFR